MYPRLSCRIRNLGQVSLIVLEGSGRAGHVGALGALGSNTLLTGS